MRSFGTNDWFIDEAEVHPLVGAEVLGLDLIFFKKTSEPSMGTTSPALLPTATVSTGRLRGRT